MGLTEDTNSQGLNKTEKYTLLPPIRHSTHEGDDPSSGSMKVIPFMCTVLAKWSCFFSLGVSEKTGSCPAGHRKGPQYLPH